MARAGGTVDWSGVQHQGRLGGSRTGPPCGSSAAIPAAGCFVNSVAALTVKLVVVLPCWVCCCAARRFPLVCWTATLPQSRRCGSCSVCESAVAGAGARLQMPGHHQLLPALDSLVIDHITKSDSGISDSQTAQDQLLLIPYSGTRYWLPQEPAFQFQIAASAVLPLSNIRNSSSNC